MHMTEFEKRVYEAVCTIPRGEVRSYGDVAMMAGYPGASRAVGNALHKNPDSDSIPCHRVVYSDGRLSPAYAFGGIDVQKALLETEGVKIIDNKVVHN